MSAVTQAHRDTYARLGAVRIEQVYAPEQLDQATALIDEILVTIIVVLVMVMHLRSSVLISGLLPLTVLMVFIAMKLFGVDANIVALSGIAIAIGTIVDMGIVVTENILKHMDEAAHKKLTGVSNRLILDNLRQLSAHGHNIILRFAIIPGLNDSDDELKRMCEWIVGELGDGAVPTVGLLGKGLADDGLRTAVAVNRRGIDKIDPGFNSSVQDS